MRKIGALPHIVIGFNGVPNSVIQISSYTLKYLAKRTWPSPCILLISKNNKEVNRTELITFMTCFL